MNKHRIPLMIVLLVSACGTPTTEIKPPTKPAATATPLLPTKTSTPLPSTETSTPLPATETSTPQPIDTATIAPTPTLDIPKERVEVAYEDRVIWGTLIGEGEVVVVLAPGYTVDRSVWIPFARHLASLDFTALAFDFPGFGTSSGDVSTGKMKFDVVAVIDYLQERGYENIVCMGFSMGGIACYDAALLITDLLGLVIISSIFTTTAEEAAILNMPKLLVSGDEPDVLPLLKDVYRLLPTPKQFEIFLVSSHGTDIFNTDFRDEFCNLLVGFLESLQ